MKQCPKCRSSRIRRGYAHDPLLVRMLGFRELLCDACNLRFRGFVLPGTLSRSHHKRKPEKAKVATAGTTGGKTTVVKPRSEPKRCPECASPSTHRSHRRGVIENIASLARVYPYRCDDCNKRFLGRRKRPADEER